VVSALPEAPAHRQDGYRAPDPDDPVNFLTSGRLSAMGSDRSLGSGLVQRFMGIGPVLLLSSAGVISAVIGLNLSHDSSPPGVADVLGCRHISSGVSATGVRQEICSYHGDRIVIWSFSRGSNVVYPVSWMESGVEGPTWIVGCGHGADCLGIRGRLGGRLLGGAWLGSSVEIQ
jgi:hypothetical protein